MQGADNPSTNVKVKRGKVALPDTEQEKKNTKHKKPEESFRTGSLSDFLSSAKDLGTAVPVVPSEVDESEEEEDSVDNGDDAGSDLSIDERVLMLRRFQDGDGEDWVGAYAGSSEDDDDDGPQPDDEEDDDNEENGDSSGDDDEDEEVAPPPPIKKKPSQVAALEKIPRATISGHAAPLHKKEQAAAVAAPLVRSSALTAAVRPLDVASTSDRADALAGIPVFRKEVAPAARRPRPPAAASPEEDAAAEGPRAPPAGRPPKPPSSRPTVSAFVPADATRCAYVGNLPLDCTSEQLQKALGTAGGVKAVHIEHNNNGRSAGFGYVEFSSTAGVAGAVRAAAAVGESGSALALGGRELRIVPYTKDLNYRNPDGSRKREKKKQGGQQQQSGKRDTPSSGKRDTPSVVSGGVSQKASAATTSAAVAPLKQPHPPQKNRTHGSGGTIPVESTGEKVAGKRRRASGKDT